jgi:phosphate starvation-inducible protein PhoH
VHVKKKKKCDDAEEATASKIVHRNVVIIRDSSVETLSTTQKLYLKSIISRTLKMNIGSFQAVLFFF